MSELPLSPYQILQLAVQLFKAQKYNNSLKLCAALLLKYQPSAPLLILAAASASRLSQLLICRQILQIAKQSNCFLDRDFKIYLYEIIFVAEFNARSDKYYAMAQELMKLTRNLPSPNVRAGMCYYYLSRMDVGAAESEAAGDLDVYSEDIYLSIRLIKGEAIDVDQVSQKNQHSLAQLEQYFHKQFSNLIFDRSIYLTRKPYILQENQLMSYNEELEVLNTADWHAAAHYLFDASGEQLGDVTACNRIFSGIKQLGFYNEESNYAAVLKLVSLWSRRNLVCNTLVRTLHGVFHNMSLIWRSDLYLAKALSVASLVSVQGQFSWEFADLDAICGLTSLDDILARYPQFVDVTAQNTEYLAQFASFLDQDSCFYLLFNIYLAINQQDATKHMREHASLLVFYHGRRLGLDAHFLAAVLLGRHEPFAYDSEANVDSFKRLTPKQVHYLLSITDVKSQLLMDRLFKLLRAKIDAHSALLKATLLLTKSGLNEAFRQAFALCYYAQQPYICADVEARTAKQLFAKYSARLREEVDVLLNTQYGVATSAPRQLYVVTLCYLAQFELDQFKAEQLSALLLATHEREKAYFCSREAPYLRLLATQVAAKLESTDLLYFSSGDAALTVFRAIAQQRAGELEAAAAEAAHALELGQNTYLLKAVVRRIQEQYLLQRRAGGTFSTTFSQNMKKLCAAEYCVSSAEPWLVYPNAVLKRVRGDSQCSVRSSGEQLEFAQHCFDALCGKTSARDIAEMAADFE